MASMKEDFISIDLRDGRLFRSFAHHSIGEGDVNADKFGVKLFKDGEPISLESYEVIGYFIRQDKATVLINGATYENTAFVTLPQECYAEEGNFSLAIKLIGGGITATMRIVDGSVVNTATNAVVDPGEILPDIEELMAAVERAEAAIEIIEGFTITEEQVEMLDYRLIVDVVESGG